MPAYDSESGSSTYKGGNGSAGGLGNAGIGGGMGGGGNWGGGMGGGAGINGGIGNKTGLTTGNTMYGNTAFGRPGGSVQGYATRGLNGQLGAFRNPDGSYVMQGPLSGTPRRPGVAAPITQAPLPGVPTPVAAVPPTIQNPFYQPSLNNVADFIQAMKNKYSWGAAQPGPGPVSQNPSWGPITDVFTKPTPGDNWTNHPWTGSPLSFSGVNGGMGFQGYNGGPAQSPTRNGGGGW